MRPKGKWYLVLAVGIAAIIIGLSVRPKDSPTQPSYNTINDTSSGLSFNVSKTFQPIPREELSALNSGFGYGFRPADDPTTYCVVSQNKLSGSGVLTGAQLRDGIIMEVKKLHPNTKLTNPQTAANLVVAGQAKGVLLQLTFKDGKVKSNRVELLVVGKTSQVTAYCQARAADNTKYYNDFTVLFSSLKLTK